MTPGPAPPRFRLDFEAIGDMVGARDIRLATEPEMARLYPDCETGATAPFGPLYGQPVYVEESLARDPEITFHAGTHVDAMRMRFADFVNLVHPIPARIALRSH